MCSVLGILFLSEGKVFTLVEPMCSWGRGPTIQSKKMCYVGRWSVLRRSVNQGRRREQWPPACSVLYELLRKSRTLKGSQPRTCHTGDGQGKCPACRWVRLVRGAAGGWRNWRSGRERQRSVRRFLVATGNTLEFSDEEETTRGF